MHQVNQVALNCKCFGHRKGKEHIASIALSWLLLLSSAAINRRLEDARGDYPTVRLAFSSSEGLQQVKHSDLHHALVMFFPSLAESSDHNI